MNLPTLQSRIALTNTTDPTCDRHNRASLPRYKSPEVRGIAWHSRSRKTYPPTHPRIPPCAATNGDILSRCLIVHVLHISNCPACHRCRLSPLINWPYFPENKARALLSVGLYEGSPGGEEKNAPGTGDERRKKWRERRERRRKALVDSPIYLSSPLLSRR